MRNERLLRSYRRRIYIPSLRADLFITVIADDGYLALFWMKKRGRFRPFCRGMSEISRRFPPIIVRLLLLVIGGSKIL